MDNVYLISVVCIFLSFNNEWMQTQEENGRLPAVTAQTKRMLVNDFWEEKYNSRFLRMLEVRLNNHVEKIVFFVCLLLCELTNVGSKVKQVRWQIVIFVRYCVNAKTNIEHYKLEQRHRHFSFTTHTMYLYTFNTHHVNVLRMNNT